MLEERKTPDEPALEEALRKLYAFLEGCAPADREAARALVAEEFARLFSKRPEHERLARARVEVQRYLRRLQPVPAREPRPTPRFLPASLRPWNGPPIPANATAVPTFYVSNGVYGLYRDNQLSFLVRIVAGKAEAWLNLWADSGHYDAGNVGQAYHANGLMEDFSNWDTDSPAYPARMSFGDWRKRCLGEILVPVPDFPDATRDFDFQARMRALFAGPPPAWRPPEGFPSRFLELLRRLPRLCSDCFASRRQLREALLEVAGLGPEWADYLSLHLPRAVSPAQEFLSEEPLVRAIRAFPADYAEAHVLRRLAEFPE